MTPRSWGFKNHTKSGGSWQHCVYTAVIVHVDSFQVPKNLGHNSQGKTGRRPSVLCSHWSPCSELAGGLYPAEIWGLFLSGRKWGLVSTTSDGELCVLGSILHLGNSPALVASLTPSLPLHQLTLCPPFISAASSLLLWPDTFSPPMGEGETEGRVAPLFSPFPQPAAAAVTDRRRVQSPLGLPAGKHQLMEELPCRAVHSACQQGV